MRYRNNLDVAPFLEALQNLRKFYFEYGIDVLKHAFSLPGVSLQYLSRGTHATRNGTYDLLRGAYATRNEAYKILKQIVTGGLSIVFTRYHEVT